MRIRWGGRIPVGGRGAANSKLRLYWTSVVLTLGFHGLGWNENARIGFTRSLDSRKGKRRREHTQIAGATWFVPGAVVVTVRERNDVTYMGAYVPFMLEPDGFRGSLLVVTFLVPLRDER